MDRLNFFSNMDARLIRKLELRQFGESDIYIFDGVYYCTEVIGKELILFERFMQIYKITKQMLLDMELDHIRDLLKIHLKQF